MVDEAATPSARLGLFRPTRERLLALVWVLGAVVLWLAVDAATTRGFGHDAHAYWIVRPEASAYGRLPGEPDAFLYSPLLAQAAQLLTWLPWPAFLVLWTGAAIATYLWLLRPLRWFWAVPLAAIGVEDVTLGNMTWLLALLAVLALTGRQRPVWWVPAAFAKLSAGVGILWHAVRRDWAGLLVAGAVAAALLSVSVAISPGMWSAYVAFLRTLDGTGVAMRTLIAAVIVVLAARSDRPWLVPIALVVCAPLPLAYTWGYLLAVPRVLPPEWVARINAPFGGFRAGLRRGLDLPSAPRAAG